MDMLQHAKSWGSVQCERIQYIPRYTFLKHAPMKIPRTAPDISVEVFTQSCALSSFADTVKLGENDMTVVWALSAHTWNIEMY